MMRKFEMPWRTAYEAYAAAGWIVAVVVLIGVATLSPLPAAPVWYMFVIALFFVAVNLQKAWSIWTIKFALCGWSIEKINYDELKVKINQFPNKVWLGYGFDWKPEHTQRVYELKKLDPSSFYPPDAFLKVREKIAGKKVGSLNKDLPGEPWIHGVEPNEVDIVMPIDNLLGNTLILGINRCGKTRLLDVFGTQMVDYQSSAVLCFDPKGDKELEDNLRRSTIKSGRGEKDFMLFHLAFPAKSVRIDPLKNYTNPSEIATRLTSLMSSQTALEDPFQAFAWSATNAITLGMLSIGEKPTILKIRRYIEGGIDDLCLKTIVRHIDNMESAFTHINNWEGEKKRFISRKIRLKEGQAEREANDRERLEGLLQMYKDMFVPLDGAVRGIRSEAVDAVVDFYKHDLTHYDKMVANYKPILTMLSTGALGELLSPDGSDIDDERLVTDMMSIINNKSVIYFGLNALGDKTTASAVCALLYSDLAACAAARYNFKGQVGDVKQKIFILADEIAESANEPFVQLLNKGGGAGFITVAATQTISDLIVRMGSEEKANQMLGNFNNLFALRTTDRVTQEFVVSSFGESYVQSLQTTQGTNSSTEKNVTHFGGTISERMNETLEASFPPELLAMMPNWQYIGRIGGGRRVKGRVPIIEERQL